MYKNAGEYLCKIMYKKNAWQREKSMKQKKILGSFEPIKKMLDKSKIHIYTKNCITEMENVHRDGQSYVKLILNATESVLWTRMVEPFFWKLKM